MNNFVLALTGLIVSLIVTLATLSFMEGQQTKENRNGFQGTSPVQAPLLNKGDASPQ
jgi:hypothetical protein